jgi:hypothetical protein
MVLANQLKRYQISLLRKDFRRRGKGKGHTRRVGTTYPARGMMKLMIFQALAMMILEAIHKRRISFAMNYAYIAVETIFVRKDEVGVALLWPIIGGQIQSGNRRLYNRSHTTEFRAKKERDIHHGV